MEENKTEVKKVFEFRRLMPSDLFLMTTIISKIGINEFSQCFNSNGVQDLIRKLAEKMLKQNEEQDEEENQKNTVEDISMLAGIGVALEIGNVILGNLYKCEKEIYQMLANVSNKTIEEIKELDIALFAEMIIEFVKKEEFKDFFKVASRFIK